MWEPEMLMCWSARFVFMLVLGVAEPGYGLVEDINGVGL